MLAEMNEFLEEQMKGLSELAAMLRKSRVAAARKAAVRSAARIKSLNLRVRKLARSGVHLSSVSHGAVQDLIELQADIVTSALDETSERIQRMVHTENVRDLARLQGEALQDAKQRIVDDIARAVTILKGAAGAARKDAAAATAPRRARPRKTVKRRMTRRKTKAGAKSKKR